MNNHLLKYGLVGVFNTLFGYSIIFSLMYLGLIPELSNLIGYFFGIIVSYYLNKYFTFQKKQKSKKEFIQFVLSMGIAFIVNFIVLFISYRIFNINPYLSQIIAGVFYTLTGFILSKYWVFKE